MTSYQSDNWGQDIYACSWCGEDDDPPYIEAGGSQDGAVYQVRCPGCGCAGPKRLQAEECARDWNEIATPAPGWVAVGDDLPALFGNDFAKASLDCLAVNHGTRVLARYLAVSGEDEYWTDAQDGRRLANVTHWMELPALPPAPAKREESK